MRCNNLGFRIRRMTAVLSVSRRNTHPSDTQKCGNDEQDGTSFSHGRASVTLHATIRLQLIVAAKPRIATNEGETPVTRLMVDLLAGLRSQLDESVPLAAHRSRHRSCGRRSCHSKLIPAPTDRLPRPPITSPTPTTECDQYSCSFWHPSLLPLLESPGGTSRRD
jgi:hypothetical protein